MTLVRWSALLVALHVAVAAGFALVSPPGDGPDEPQHVAYLEHVLRTGHAPSLDWLGESPHTYEAHQFPLYYFWTAALLRGIGVASVADSLDACDGYGVALCPAPAVTRPWSDPSRRWLAWRWRRSP
jgi:hypothetical protein